MEMMKEDKYVPILRFAGFEEAWEVKKLKDLCRKTISYGIVQTGENVSDGIPCVRVVDLTKSKLEVDEMIRTSEKISHSYRKTILEKDDIILALRGEIGLVKKTPIELIGINLTRGVAKVSPNTEIITSDFLLWAIRSTKFKFELNRRVNGSALKEIPLNGLREVSVLLTTLPEQQKIATFLSAIDRKIQQLRRKVELLEQYKKGVMQRIFKQEVRFKGENGEEFADWEEKKLGEIANKVSTKNRKNDVTFVLTNSATKGIISQQDYFNKDIANQDNLDNYYIVDIDDFVYNPRISAFASVGPIKRNKLSQGVMSPLYTVFRISDNCSLSFLEFYFETTHWHKYMKGIANYGARHDRMNITSGDFFKMPIPFPSLKEQEKIANFLTRLDNKIDHFNSQLTQTQTFKKGLLQQLFV